MGLVDDIKDKVGGGDGEGSMDKTPSKDSLDNLESDLGGSNGRGGNRTSQSRVSPSPQGSSPRKSQKQPERQKNSPNPPKSNDTGGRTGGGQNNPPASNQGRSQDRNPQNTTQPRSGPGRGNELSGDTRGDSSMTAQGPNQSNNSLSQSQNSFEESSGGLGNTGTSKLDSGSSSTGELGPEPDEKLPPLEEEKANAPSPSEDRFDALEKQNEQMIRILQDIRDELQGRRR
ncbi:MAG: hypothetical protein MUP58_02275 [Candidatus Nanohaloarchaeota archaeon QJJ-9]|nr:hypothetical protein [Candidatus Nanohaloarchaeota archaeon QJJ-9]